jgi:hypothetical protein
MCQELAPYVPYKTVYKSLCIFNPLQHLRTDSSKSYHVLLKFLNSVNRLRNTIYWNPRGDHELNILSICTKHFTDA